MPHFTAYAGKKSLLKRVPAAFKRKSILKTLYVALMLWFVGRAVQAASRVDKTVRREVSELPHSFSFSLAVWPAGPSMLLKKLDSGVLKYMGRVNNRKPDVSMEIKSLQAAFFLFTFQESTCVATARNRLMVTGDVPWTLTVVRILDAVEVYLLPRIIAELAVKRYPKWPVTRKFFNRVRIYWRALAGY